MESEAFNKIIGAPRSKVWEVLWTSETYKQWTSPFGTGNMVVADWQNGGLIRCTDPENNGLVTRIVDLKKAEFVRFEPVAIIHNGIEDYESKEVLAWSGAYESYTLLEIDNGQTELIVQMNFSERERFAVMGAFPKALEIVKRLSEM